MSILSGAKYLSERVLRLAIREILHCVQNDVLCLQHSAKKDNRIGLPLYKVWLLSLLVAPLAVGVGTKMGVVEAAFARNLPA